MIDGEAIVCDENGLAVFELIRRHGALASAVLCAFDLLELDGRDLRRGPIEKRKALLAKLLKGEHVSIVLNEHFEEDGAIVFREACKLGCEGIVSKRLGSPYRSGRSQHWVKVKNLNNRAAIALRSSSGRNPARLIAQGAGNKYGALFSAGGGWELAMRLSLFILGGFAAVVCIASPALAAIRRSEFLLITTDMSHEAAKEAALTIASQRRRVRGCRLVIHVPVSVTQGVNRADIEIEIDVGARLATTAAGSGAASCVTRPSFQHQRAGYEGQVSIPEQNEIVWELAGPSQHLLPATSKLSSGSSSLNTSSS